MSWDTATLLSVVKEGSMVKVSYRLSNTSTGEVTDLATHGNDLTASFLADMVKQQLDLLNIRDASFATHTPGPITLPTPTAQQTAIEAFFAKDANLDRLRRLVKRGMLAADDASVLAAIDDLKTTFNGLPAGTRNKILNDSRFG